jgi:hypothetical protein
MTYAGYAVLLACLALGLVSVALRPGSAQARAAAGSIHADDHWAWGSNIGWINFAPAHGGVTVYVDHLEGYAWGENIGWIRMGSYESGGPHVYANTAAGNYGVNNDGSGNLSGYAWGTNVGWIKFDPAYGGVTVDMSSGEFDGYAWGENVGWISFNGPGYKVVAPVYPYRVYLPLVVRSGP